AMDVYKKSYNAYNALGDSVNMAYSLMFQAMTYRESGEPGNAVPLLYHALRTVQHIKDIDLQMADLYMELYKSYRALHDYKNSLESFEMAMEYKSGILSTETANKISELKEKYETEKKE